MESCCKTSRAHPGRLDKKHASPGSDCGVQVVGERRREGREEDTHEDTELLRIISLSVTICSCSHFLVLCFLELVKTLFCRRFPVVKRQVTFQSDFRKSAKEKITTTFLKVCFLNLFFKNCKHYYRRYLKLWNRKLVIWSMDFRKWFGTSPYKS